MQFCNGNFSRYFFMTFFPILFHDCFCNILMIVEKGYILGNNFPGWEEVNFLGGGAVFWVVIIWGGGFSREKTSVEQPSMGQFS